ncbi:MAG TPA: hypothetical protein VK928_01730 [Longimicrobiales bacterium]|nr:hypothetical protein [Longimicrobiales bacterium]
MSDVAERIRRVICDVVAEALRQSGAAGVAVLEDWTPEGELLYEWLVRSLGEPRVWREAAVASNVHGTGAAAVVLLAHPSSRTALLLEGRPPDADLFPFGDLAASRLAMLAGGWTGTAEVRALADAAGGVEALDAALERVVAGGGAVGAAATLPGDAEAGLLRLYERGRFFRRHARLVPKLGPRTLGIDLFD